MATGKMSVPGFDWEEFRLFMGVGWLCLGMGLLLGWATLTAPEGESNSTGFTTAQRLARLLPHSVQEKIALGLAVLFILFGALLLLIELWTIGRHVVNRLRK